MFAEWQNAVKTSQKAVEMLGIMTTGDSPRRRMIFGNRHGEGQRLAEQEADGQDYLSTARKLEALLDEWAWLKKAHLEWTNSLAYKISREIKRPWRQIRAKLRGLRRDRVEPTDASAPPSAKAA